MKLSTPAHALLTGLALTIAPLASAEVQVSNYDDLTEGFLGTSYLYNGISYHDVNGVSGVFPDGSSFTPADTGDQLIIENAKLLHDNFPAWGSPKNVLNFGSAYIPGDNLTIGAFSRVTMDLSTPASNASVAMAFYQNGPWGGIKFHMQALKNGQIVDSAEYTIADEGGRDSVTTTTLSVSAASFDSIKLFATFGDSYSAPRLVVDNLSITTVPAPASMLALAPLALRRRRR